MKSKQFSKENQRIERITQATLVVGIDIAKEMHVAQAVTFRGITLSRQAFSFANSEGGFESLERIIRKWQQIGRMNDVIIGMESTGHYWFNLADWLMERGIQVVIVNPATTKRNKENRDNTPSKSDAKDALVIADVVSRGYYTPYQTQEEAFERIRTLMTNRERWVTQSTRLSNQITRWLDIRFPEMMSVFKEVGCARSLATLHEFPAPSDLLGLTPEEVVNRWGKHMKRPGGTRGLRKARQLLKQASLSVGKKTSLEEDKWDLACLLDEYERVQRILEETNARIDQLLAEIPGVAQLESMGLTRIYIAAILAGAGDLRKFEHGNQLLRKAGLNIAERSSGKYQGKVKLSKRGSSMLRKYLYLAVLHLTNVNPEFQAWRTYNLEVKRIPKKKSAIKLIGKLARMLVAMSTTGEFYSAEKARPHSLAV